MRWSMMGAHSLQHSTTVELAVSTAIQGNLNHALQIALGLYYSTHPNDLGVSSTHQFSQFWSLNLIAFYLLMCTDDHQTALTCLEQVDTLPVDHYIFTEKITLDGLFALTHYHRGDLVSTYHRIVSAHDKLQAIPFQTGHMLYLGLCTLTEALFNLWRSLSVATETPARHIDRNSLRKMAKDLCARLEKYSYEVPIAKPLYNLCLGKYHLLTGDTNSAVQCFELCLSSAKRVNMVLEEGFALFELGLLHKSQHILLLAKEIFAKVGARSLQDTVSLELLSTEASPFLTQKNVATM